MTNLHTEPRADVSLESLLVEAPEERGGFAGASDEAAEGSDGPFLGPQRAGGSVDSTPLPRGGSEVRVSIAKGGAPRPVGGRDSRSAPREKRLERRQPALQAGEHVRAGIVHATGAPAVGSGRRIPPSQPAAAAAAPATPPPSAAPATTASRNGVVEPLPGGRFEATPFLPAFLPIPPEPAFLSFLFGCVTATHKGRSHVGASSLAAYV